jgi:hypothetical protein
MSAVDLNAPIHHWRCPACPAYSQTQRADVHQEYHSCPGTGGLNIPLVEVDSPDGTPDARHIPQLGENGGITSIGTHHGNGRIDRTILGSIQLPGA